VHLHWQPSEIDALRVDRFVQWFDDLEAYATARETED